MPKYKIVSSASGWPRGFRFMTISKFPLEVGDPILFLLNGVLQVGRWFANIAGFNWIVQSDRAIRIIQGSTNISIVGLIVPLKATSWLN